MLGRRFKNSDFYQKHRYRIERGNDTLSFVSALLLILFLFGDQSYVAKKKHAMGNQIRITALVTGFNTGVFRIDKGVIRAMAQVPRHRYVGPHLGNYAYHNIALPVANSEHMIPEPFITAVMIDLMDIGKDDNILDIGYGFGYEAAVISKLAGNVHSISLDALANDNKPHYKNITMHQYTELTAASSYGPYDAILVRQSMIAPPVALLRQLKHGGHLIIPIGAPNDIQRLMVYTKTNGGITERRTLHVKITPLLKGKEI